MLLKVALLTYLKAFQLFLKLFNVVARVTLLLCGIFFFL